jgi:hypothetical protein
MENALPWIESFSCTLPMHALHILADVERCVHLPADELAMQLRPVIGRVVVSESLFPEVRTLAYLMAQGASPGPADWLAARVVVFRLNHLALSLSELGMMDVLNQKLAWLSVFLQLELPLLRSFALQGALPGKLCQGGTPMLLRKQGSVVVQSLALREQLRPWLVALTQAWQAQF